MSQYPTNVIQLDDQIQRQIDPISYLTIEQGPQKSSWAVGAKLLVDAPVEQINI